MGNFSDKKRCSCDKCEQKRKSEKDGDNCKGCICEQLKKLQMGTQLNLYLSSGQVFENVYFNTLNQKNCCALFSDPSEATAPTLIVDCESIQAISIVTA
ncbi:hydrolase [Sporosarcina sp. ANT_H38]|uniref:hydrolase n=1 Tax=Sporosarcina sp. ANT_H38 TaxID=2597358 RepID=UPI0011F17A39|nr:hydrolase [Sporosarcina sp. ANT_H38]KAA0965801.1 hydrolase [Sporosarcina sp. ANT_H38]